MLVTNFILFYRLYPNNLPVLS